MQFFQPLDEDFYLRKNEAGSDLFEEIGS